MSWASSEAARSRKAAIYLLSAVVVISVLPLSMVMVGAADSPFLFGAALSVGTSVGALAFLHVRYRLQMRDPAILDLLRKNLVSLPIFFILVGTFDFTFFAWSTRFLDAAVATILWGSWPIIFVFLLRRIFGSGKRGPKRYGRITLSLVVLMIMSLAGLGFVVLAESTDQTGFNWTADLSYLGLLLALISGVLIGLNIFGFSWAADMTVKTDALPGSKRAHGMELFFITVVIFISNLFTVPIKMGISLASSEEFQLDVIMAGLIVGSIIRAGSSILWRKANLMTHALGINALGYAEPVFAVLWLFLFWEVHVARIDYLIIGTCAIVASNILINSESDIGPGLRSAVPALWTTGAVVYLRDQGLYWGSGEYLVALVLFAALFAVLLSIRVGRNSWAVTGRHIQHPSLLGGADPANLTRPFARRGHHLLNMFVLGTFAGVAVFFAVFTRPLLTGQAGWLVDTLAILYCGLIAFAMFSWPKLQPDVRTTPFRTDTVAGIPALRQGGRVFAKHLRIERWVSTLVALGVFGVFAYLFWDKWLNGGG